MVGLDEVGRGCLAGPVFAGALCIDERELAQLTRRDLALLRDSKSLTAAQRGRARLLAHSVARAWGIGMAYVYEIEALGIVRATFLAMKRAFLMVQDQLSETVEADHGQALMVLIDGTQVLPDLRCPQRSVVGGDDLCHSIGGAAILAKVERDAHMSRWADLYPHYGFARNVGYGTAEHLDALRRLGPCELHRRNFAPVRSLTLTEDRPSVATTLDLQQNHMLLNG